MENYRITEVHISKIEPGDTVIHNGKEKTVGKDDISYCPFMGISLFGDTYRLGTVLVKKVLFPKWYKGEIIGYFAKI